MEEGPDLVTQSVPDEIVRHVFGFVNALNEKPTSLALVSKQWSVNISLEQVFCWL